MFEWKFILNQVRTESEAAKAKRDRVHLANYHQRLLDSGVVKTRADAVSMTVV